MNKDILDEFISYLSKERKKSVSYLRRNMSLTDEQAEDIFQDSCISCYQNLKEGNLQSLTCTLSTYLNRICINKAHNFIRDNKDKIHSKKNSSDDDNSTSENRFIYIDEKLDEILDLTEEDNSFREEKNKKVRDIVKNLPKPCDSIFWGMYRDGLSLKKIGEMLGYASYDVIKITRQRCIKKFKEKFEK